MLNNTEKTMEKIVALCKNRGFIFAGSDIYGGLANTWDYGPLGARMKNNVKDTCNDGHIIALGIFPALTELTFNGFFTSRSSASK